MESKNKYAVCFAQIKRLQQKGIDVDRKKEILAFTNGQKSSLKELGHIEYLEFISRLKQKEAVADMVEYSDSCNKVRRKIIALFCKMDWKTPDGKADMERIECWCIKHGKFHKRLNDHSYSQIIEVCSQVERVYASFIRGL